MAKPLDESIRLSFEAAFKDYHLERERKLDPISLVYPYKDNKDREIVAFLVALISYGNVRTILQSGEKLLTPLGPSPYSYLISEKPLGLWPSFKHRFTTGKDIEILAHWLRTILLREGTLENFFLKVSGTADSNMKVKLSRFVAGIWSEKLPEHLLADSKKRTRNLKYLLSNPDQGSACKRLNMFLRWVVRPNDGIDLGIWKGISPRELMLPLDTHLIQTLKKLRWIQKETANWNAVEAATQRLRTISAEDPIRYDFALCHLSMSGGNIKEIQKNFKKANLS
ncbi:MAG: TIGR02757 family protein [Proteobacteria bacterium]|jgi:uncharacterized protein (TIGR02757 family)|nr:TIGR02757 family protein [Pseudomonadota bacterium]